MIKIQKVIRTPGEMDKLAPATTMTLLEFYAWLTRTVRETRFWTEESGSVDGGCALWSDKGQEYVCSIVREDL